MTLHTCDALVVSCIDFRFQKFIRDWLDRNLTNETFDYVGFAGGSKDIDTILQQLEISVRLHHINQVILMNHEDCGAYGAESTPERHEADLRKAKAAILAKYPNLKIDLYYLHLDGQFEQIPSTVMV
jgi:carbonic anhydrase